MIRDIYNTLLSGRVQRWHSNPFMAGCGESNDQHQWSVAMIALHLEPRLSRTALIWCLTHDVGEMVAGDLSRDFKRANPGIAEAHREFEDDARDKLVSDCNDLSREEGIVCKAADWIAAYAAMIRYQPWMRFRDDWKAQVDETVAALLPLGERYWLDAATLIDDLNTEAAMRDGRHL